MGRIVLEERVQKIMRPRNGKLLGRQWHRVGIFYEEVAVVDEAFIALLNRHISAGRGSIAALLDRGVKRDALRSYRSGKRVMPFENYLAIASALNTTAQNNVKQKELPDSASGYYVGMLFSWYFDKIDARTRNSPSLMSKAITLLLDELARADISIQQKLRGTEIDNRNARTNARDILTGRGGFVPYSVLRLYEGRVIRSLDIGGVTSPEELREAFRQADTKNLESSLTRTCLETSLKNLSEKARMRQKPYRFENGFTPRGIDYFEGDRITHAQFGQGVVLESGAGKPPKLMGMQSPRISYTIKVDFGPAGRKGLLVNHEA